MDPHNLNIILIALHKSVEIIKEMREKGQDNCPRVASLEERTRFLEDQSDHHHQRSLKGKFVISSFKDNNIIKDEKKLKEEGKSLTKYVMDLVASKLGVEVREEEIISCHHTKTGIFFRLGNFKPGSSFSKVVTAIKSGQGKELNNIFINFALTPRRAALLYEIRQLRKAKKVFKFYTDFDGSIAIVKEEGTKRKEKVTDVVVREEGTAGGQERRGDRSRVQPRTMTVEELRERFGGQV